MSHQGSCHCGKISFSVRGEIDSLTECNCSLCSKRGGLLWFVGREQLQLKSPEGELPTYRFNTRKIAHHFCDVCGCSPFSEAPVGLYPPIPAAANVSTPELACVRDVTRRLKPTRVSVMRDGDHTRV